MVKILGGALSIVSSKENKNKIYKLLYESSFDAIMTIEPPNWNFTSGNPATVKLFGVKDEEELITLAPSALSPESQPNGKSSKELSKEMISQALKNGSNLFEWTHQKKNGQVFFASVLLTKMDINGKDILQATVRDVSKDKKLQIKSSLLAEIVDASDDAILSKDLVGKILSFNKGAEEIYGYKAKEIIGKNVSVLLPEGHKDEVTNILKRIKKGEKIEHFKTKRKCKDGKVIDVSISISPVNDEFGKIVGASSIARDISEEIKANKQLKEKFDEAEKFNKLMVGRELKMIELKDEVVKLKHLLENNQQVKPEKQLSWTDKFNKAIELEESVIIKLRDHYKQIISNSKISENNKGLMLKKLNVLVEESLGHKKKLEGLILYEQSK